MKGRRIGTMAGTVSPESQIIMYAVNFSHFHPSIHFLHHLSNLGSQGRWSLFQTDFEREAGMHPGHGHHGEIGTLTCTS